MNILLGGTHYEKITFIFALTIVLTFLWSYTTNADITDREAPIFIKDDLEYAA